jgi:hypothetical protein
MFSETASLSQPLAATEGFDERISKMVQIHAVSACF